MISVGRVLETLKRLQGEAKPCFRIVVHHGQVLESIHAAVAIYGADKRLSFFNSAFAGLWGIEEEWLAGEPSLDELLERLRERRRVPEYADFRAFKRQHGVAPGQYRRRLGTAPEAVTSRAA